MKKEMLFYDYVNKAEKEIKELFPERMKKIEGLKMSLSALQYAASVMTRELEEADAELENEYLQQQLEKTRKQERDQLILDNLCPEFKVIHPTNDELNKMSAMDFLMYSIAPDFEIVSPSHVEKGGE